MCPGIDYLPLHMPARASMVPCPRSNRYHIDTDELWCAGELAFNAVGLLFQLASIFTEAGRLVLVQVLLQQGDVRLDPISSLYYIAPPCFCILVVPFGFAELFPMMADDALSIPFFLLIVSSLAAFGRCKRSPPLRRHECSSCERCTTPICVAYA